MIEKIHRLKQLYFFALVFIATVLIASSLLLQYAIEKNAGDSRVINLAGRQRMLSQRLTKDVLALKYSCPNFSCPAKISEISNSLGEWKKAHLGLQKGDANLQLVARENSSQIVRYFSELDKPHKVMVDAIDSLLGQMKKNTLNKDAEAQMSHDIDNVIGILLENEKEFLPLMDKITFQFDSESKARITSINEFERYFLLIGIFVLAMEFVFVFRPSVLRMMELFKALMEKTDELATVNGKLNFQLEELKQLRHKADCANRAKSTFLSSMSHEIRTPLNSVIGFSDLLEKRVEGSKEKQYLQAVRSSGYLLLKLINDVLDLSKIEAGKMEIRIARVNFPQTLAEIALTFREKIEAKCLKFEFSVAQNIPEILLLDDVRIRQILFNLIGNSIKFTSKGAISVSITSNESTIGTDVSSLVDLIFVVEDTGCGMSQEYLEHIFSPFVQENNDLTIQHTGTGLGLAITKHLVELMHGEISVESVLDKGSRFTVRIPNVSVSESSAVPQSAEEFEYGSVEFDEASILIVDDVDLNRKYLKEVFSYCPNIRVFDSEDGRAALDLLKVQKIDLVLMDVRMPRINGIEAAKKVRESGPNANTKVVMITGSVFELEGIRADVNLAKYVDDYLHKPVRPSEIVKCVTKFLSHRVIESALICQKSQNEKCGEDGSAELTLEQKNVMISLYPYWQENILPLRKRMQQSFSSDDVVKLYGYLLVVSEKTNNFLLVGCCKNLKRALEDFDLSKIQAILEDVGKYEEIFFRS